MELEIPSLTASSLDAVELVVVGEFVTAEPSQAILFPLLSREEREKYYYHRGKAKDAIACKSYMCLIIDGMDQNKLLIPSLINQAKSYGSAWRLKTHLTGLFLLHCIHDRVSPILWWSTLAETPSL